MCAADPIGIDLGTTHSVVAVFDGDRPRVLPHPLGDTLVPSELAVDDGGHLLVGAPARTVRLRDPTRGLARFKQGMGSGQPVRLGDQELTPASASALVLRELKQAAEQQLGEPVERAVISVPAWFRESERQATLHAGRLAGLEVLRLINEPTAAALAHGLHAGDDLRSVAVLDLGGGTFDVTVLELFEGVIDVRASVGDVRLGGEDVTDAIVTWLTAEAGARALPQRAGRLRYSAERAKRALSATEAVEVVRDGLDDGTSTLTRAVLAELCAPLRDRMRRLIQQALVQAGLRGPQIDEVVLVGGAVRMPLVQELAEAQFGQPPLLLGEVDHLVALGAAVQAALVTGHEAVRERLVTDVLTHSLGVASQQRWGDQVYADRFVPVLGRGTALPASRTSTFETLHHQQTYVEFKVYEGERREASANHMLGTVRVEVPPHEEETAREDVSVRFTHDVSGLLQVEATAVSTGERSEVVLERGGQRYSPEERAAVAAELAQLKVHPRDLLPNRWLLERAITVVEHLSGSTREELDRMVLGFEAALDEGDPQRISSWRAPLNERVVGLEHSLGIEP